MEKDISGFLEFGEGPYVIVRGGPGTEKFADSYKWSCVCLIKDGYAEPVGLSNGPINKQLVSELRKLLHKAELKLQWKRIKDNRPYLIRETLGTNGEYHMARKMPKAETAMKNGKFDLSQFNANLPAAMDAVASGETKFHKVVIEADKHGKLSVTTHRTHNHDQGGIDPAISVALMKVLVDTIQSGAVKIGTMSETPDTSTADVMTMTTA